MPRTFVPHPETGLPVEVQTTYQDVERAQLEQDVNQKQALVETAANELESIQTQLDAASERHDQALEALEDSKSSLESYDAITPVSSVEPGTEGTSSEDSVVIEQPQF